MFQILIVEDELIVADDLGQILEKSGYQICGTVHSGEEGIRLAEKLRPHIVLMDIFLKGKIDGIEAAETIESSFGIPVIFLTGQSTIRHLGGLKKSDPCGFIVKPFIEKDLLSCIEKVLKQYNISSP